MQQESRYYRFDPITVRAAARVVRLGDAGRLGLADVKHCIAELAWMDADGQSRWTPALFRALYHRARRHSAFARVGAPRGFTLQRRASDAPQPADARMLRSDRL
ncbi:MAG: hypothetical protein ACK47B_23480 [Armatimonadota bacterium]